MMNFADIEFRCHSLKSLMTSPKGKTRKEKIAETKELVAKLTQELKDARLQGKSELKTNVTKQEKLNVAQQDLIALEKQADDPGELLSETTKTYLTELYITEFSGRKKEITSKYLEKGLLTEEFGITGISLATKKFLTKNTTRFSNGFITGEPDVIDGEIGRGPEVYDNKSSWDIFTYGKVKYNNEVDEVYWWQLQGYGVLLGASKLHLCYNLIDTPEPLIQNEIRSLWYKMGQPSIESEIYAEMAAEVASKLQYPDIDPVWKTHIQSFDPEPDVDIRIQDRVKLCREYMNFRFK